MNVRLSTALFNKSSDLYYLEGQYKRIDAPLWWQIKGLSYTATGYGSKIPTRSKIEVDGRLYRVYCRVYSNSGTCYIVSKGQRVIVDNCNFIEG